MLSRAAIISRHLRVGALNSVCAAVPLRLFSDDAAYKLRATFEEYRKANFSQTLPSRFAKQLISAADADGDGVLTTEELNAVLSKVGAEGASAMSEAEIEAAVATLAGEDGRLSVDEFIAILTKKA